MPGQVEPSNNEESSTSHLWKPNYQDTTNPTTPRNSLSSQPSRRKSGNSWTNRTGRSILYQPLSARWGTFLTTISLFSRDSKGVSTCTCVPELKRKNLTLTQIRWYPNYQIQKHWSLSQLQSILHTMVIPVQLEPLQSHLMGNTCVLGIKVDCLSFGM